MRRAAAVALAVAVLAPGCASGLGAPARSQVIQCILPSTVQLKAEREGGGRRAASGVVLASDVASGRSWILTTRHFLDPPAPQNLSVSTSQQKGRVRAQILAASTDADLAIIEVAGMSLPPVTLKEVSRLGDDVWVVAYPWGRRLTVVSGVVSQLVAEEGEPLAEGAARMVDASVSYGASGGGVFDARTGALIGIVEGYRTAQVAVPEAPGRVLQMPVPGETTVIPSRAIIHFLLTSGLEGLMPR
jgi:S1-C subfamily serine protease